MRCFLPLLLALLIGCSPATKLTEAERNAREIPTEQLRMTISALKSQLPILEKIVAGEPVPAASEWDIERAAVEQLLEAHRRAFPEDTEAARTAEIYARLKTSLEVASAELARRSD